MVISRFSNPDYYYYFVVVVVNGATIIVITTPSSFKNRILFRHSYTLVVHLLQQPWAFASLIVFLCDFSENENRPTAIFAFTREGRTGCARALCSSVSRAYICIILQYYNYCQTHYIIVM